MRVAVIGSGVAGMAAALALHRRGRQAILFEAFASPRPLGSGLLLQPSGLAALRSLGLLDAVLEVGARVDRLDGRDLSGRRVIDMHYADWREGAFGVGVHRASLFDILHSAVTQAGVEVRHGVDVVRLENPAQPVLRDARDQAYGPFDAVVVADGSASRLRARLRLRARAPEYSYGALWANARDVEGVFAACLHQRYDHCSMMAGVLPIGRGPDGEGDLVSFFWSLPVRQMDTFLADDLAPWRARVAALWPEAASVVTQIDDPARLARATYRNVQVGCWSVGAVTLIGDAAHGTSPQLGQGANLALIDAVELARRLEAPAARSLRRFQAARRRQTAPYQLASRSLTPLFQSNSAIWPLIRRFLFAPLSRAPGLKRISAIVLTGMFRLGPTPPDLRP